MSVMFREKPLGKYHKLTSAERIAVREARVLQEQIDEAAATIKRLGEQMRQLHDCKRRGHICTDEAGCIYDIRTCCICGHVDHI